MSRSYRETVVRTAAGLLVMAGLIGCSQPEVELASVQGKITMGGQPLPNATVRFIPINGGRTAFGKTNDQGEYEMLYSASASGAIVGPMRVEITTIDADDPKAHPETVPAKYNTDSELTAEVEAKKNVIDFQLDSK